jgi:hypothetical protein
LLARLTRLYRSIKLSFVLVNLALYPLPFSLIKRPDAILKLTSFSSIPSETAPGSLPPWPGSITIIFFVRVITPFQTNGCLFDWGNCIMMFINKSRKTLT